MTTLETILNPKAAVDAAWMAILKEAGLKNTLAVFDLEENKETPYVEIQSSNWAASGQQYDIGGGELAWSSWKCNMLSRVVTNRGTNSDKHEAMIGAIIVAAARPLNNFSPAVLKYHSVWQMKQTGSTPTTDGMNDHTEITHELEVIVRDNAWEQT